MKIALRPHHFLCLKGYKGLNYNSSQIEIWNRLSKTLNSNPDTDILIISGKDTLCGKCPAKEIHNSSVYCIEKSVELIDKKVQNLLGIVVGNVYKYADIAEKLEKIMTKEKHEELCSRCSWWKKGICSDSFD